MDCNHLIKHTERISGSPATVHGFHILGVYKSIKTPAMNSRITTWCADCGEKLKTIELYDFVKRNILSINPLK